VGKVCQLIHEEIEMTAVMKGELCYMVLTFVEGSAFCGFSYKSEVIKM